MGYSNKLNIPTFHYPPLTLSPELKSIAKEYQEDWDVRFIELESMPVEDITRWVGTAKVVVGAHGAGLANWLMVGPKTKCIQVLSYKMDLFGSRMAYRNYAQVRGAEYMEVVVSFRETVYPSSYSKYPRREADFKEKDERFQFINPTTGNQNYDLINADIRMEGNTFRKLFEMVK